MFSYSKWLVFSETIGPDGGLRSTGNTATPPYCDHCSLTSFCNAPVKSQQALLLACDHSPASWQGSPGSPNSRCWGKTEGATWQSFTSQNWGSLGLPKGCFLIEGVTSLHLLWWTNRSKIQLVNGILFMVLRNYSLKHKARWLWSVKVKAQKWNDLSRSRSKGNSSRGELRQQCLLSLLLLSPPVVSTNSNEQV